MRPDGVPAADTARIGETAPDGCGLPEPARPELEPDQSGEGTFRRTAGGPPPPDCLGEGTGLGQPVGGHGVDHRRDPSLDEGEHRFQPGQRGFLLLGILRLEEGSPGQGLVQRFGVCRIDRGHCVAQCRGVNGDSPGIVLDGAEQPGAQPGNMREQPVVCRLSHGQEQPDLVRVDR